MTSHSYVRFQRATIIIIMNAMPDETHRCCRGETTIEPYRL